MSRHPSGVFFVSCCRRLMWCQAPAVANKEGYATKIFKVKSMRELIRLMNASERKDWESIESAEWQEEQLIVRMKYAK